MKLNKIYHYFYHYFVVTKEFGIKLTVLNVLEKISRKNRYLCNIFSENKHKLVMSKLGEQYKNIIDKYRNINLKQDNIKKDDNIWVFWWQGIDESPLIVQKCVDSIIKHSNSHEVILIDKDNINDYVDIPDYIYEKLKKGYISYAHFSDILRVSLLTLYGGIWMDATLMITGDFSNKMNSYSFYSNKINPIGNFVSKCRWSGFFMASSCNNIIMKLCRDILLEYWKEHNVLIDYLLLDYIIALGYENSNEIKKMIDDIPYNNNEIYELKNKLNSEYSENEMKKIINNTCVFKLSYKEKYLEEVDSKLTFYSKLIGDNYQ